MEYEVELDRAVRSSEPLPALRSLAQALLAKGRSTAEVLELFEQARERFRQAGRGPDEDLVLDVMDFLTGWCSPHMRIDGQEHRSPIGKNAPAADSERPLAPARSDDAAA